MFGLIPLKNCNACIGDDRKDDSLDPNFEFSIFYDEEKEHMMQTAGVCCDSHPDASDQKYKNKSQLQKYLDETDPKKDRK